MEYITKLIKSDFDEVVVAGDNHCAIHSVLYGMSLLKGDDYINSILKERGFKNEIKLDGRSKYVIKYNIKTITEFRKLIYDYMKKSEKYDPPEGLKTNTYLEEMELSAVCEIFNICIATYAPERTDVHPSYYWNVLSPGQKETCETILYLYNNFTGIAKPTDHYNLLIPKKEVTAKNAEKPKTMKVKPKKEETIKNAEKTKTMKVKPKKEETAKNAEKPKKEETAKNTEKPKTMKVKSKKEETIKNVEKTKKEETANNAEKPKKGETVKNTEKPKTRKAEVKPKKEETTKNTEKTKTMKVKPKKEETAKNTVKPKKEETTINSIDSDNSGYKTVSPFSNIENNYDFNSTISEILSRTK